MSDRALVTLAVGQPCLGHWQKYCSAQWQAYANRHNLDLIIITDPLDQSDRPIPWQKCLISSQPFAANYRQIAILDADIAINPDAPNIFEQVPEDRVGGVLSGGHIHNDLKVVLLSRLSKNPPSVSYEQGLASWRADQDSIYVDEGLTPHPVGIIQTGVLVASPRQHADLFRYVYDAPDPNTRQYEQVRLSHSILSAGLFHPIDTRFNSVLFETLVVHHDYLFTQAVDQGTFAAAVRAIVRAELANNFFLHFAYDQRLMRFLAD